MSLLPSFPMPPVKGVPLFVEIPVATETRPYLVTSTRGVIWIQKPHKGLIRAALRRDVQPEELFPSVVQAVRRYGLEAGWGNSFPNVGSGLAKAVAYLEYFGFDDLELLASEASEQVTLKNIPIVTCPWIPAGSAVLVPKDRSFLGVVGTLEDSLLVVVHNPSRGMAVLGDW